MKKSSKKLPPTDPLSAALAESFKASPALPLPPVEAQSRMSAALPTAALAGGDWTGETERAKGAVKTTVSFYSVEQDQVDAILGLLFKARRRRGGFSDAVKIALRLCPLEEHRIGKAWDEARTLDQRTKRGKGK